MLMECLEPPAITHALAYFAFIHSFVFLTSVRKIFNVKAGENGRGLEKMEDQQSAESSTPNKNNSKLYVKLYVQITLVCLRLTGL